MIMPTTDLRDAAPADAFDFYDFGCSTGANITHANSVLPELRGLGIDIAPAKVAAATKNGHQAIIFDIPELPDEKRVDFVTMGHFLEHLPGLGSAQKMMAKATLSPGSSS